MEPKTCHHCGNEWEPRKANPKKCPQCQNPLWRSSRPKKISLRSPITLRTEDATSTESLVPESPTECSHAPGDKDILSQAKARAEALMRQLTQ